MVQAGGEMGVSVASVCKKAHANHVNLMSNLISYMSYTSCDIKAKSRVNPHSGLL